MSNRNTKKRTGGTAVADDLDVPPTSSAFFKKAKVGEFYARIMANCDVVRIASDLRPAFPNEKAVNQALRELLKIRETLVSITADKAKRKKSA